MFDKKKKKPPLLIYSPQKNNTLCIRSYLFIKEIIVFYAIIVFTLHQNSVKRGSKLNWNIVNIKWMVGF